MKRLLAIVCSTALLASAGVANAHPSQAQLIKKQKITIVKQKKEITRLKSVLSTDINGALVVMTKEELWSVVAKVASLIPDEDTYSVSFFQSGPEYTSYTFTRTLF